MVQHLSRMIPRWLPGISMVLGGGLKHTGRLCLSAALVIPQCPSHQKKNWRKGLRREMCRYGVDTVAPMTQTKINNRQLDNCLY